jgi:hypothetical protein
MIYRILYSLISFLAVLFLPYYISLLLVFLGVFLFRKYYEGLILLVFFETLYTTKETAFFDTFLIFSILFSIILFSKDYLKKKLNLLQNDY